MHIPFSTFLLSFWISLCAGQGTYVPPSIPAKYQKQLESAVLSAQGGNASEAIESIEELISRYPTWVEPRQAISKIYYASGQKQIAIHQLEASVAIDTLSQLQELFSLGRIYEEVSAYESALSCYDAVIKKGILQPDLVAKAQKNKQSLESRSELWNSQSTIEFIPFDEDINTPNHESLGRWTLDGQQMVFTRLVNGQEDIFFASFDSTAGLWRIDDFTFNSPQNEGAHAVSPDGNYLIFTSCNRQDSQGGCDLYLSFKHEGLWTRPTNMGPAFNNAAWDGQPCFGLDGLSLFFSSARPNGMGGRDIWYVYQQSAGKWSLPINAGPSINTTDNEESPFVHFDGQSIYFMRDGQEGLGGYDIYMSRRELNGTWGPAQNLGAPINSGANEGALTLHPNGTRAIITRETETAKNDLFEFELPQAFRSAPLQALRVTIVDQVTGLPVRSRVELFETTNFDTIRLSQWSDNEGKIAAVTQQNKDYGVMVSADGYMLYSDHLHADDSAVRELEIKLIPLESIAEKTIVLQNIFFETGSAALLQASDAELKKLLLILRKNPNMIIEIGGHTDNVGDEKVNQQLSEARAKAVNDYLTFRGIEAARITYKGYGETQPIADNDTPAGRQKNRRTEFKVMAN